VDVSRTTAIHYFDNLRGDIKDWIDDNPITFNERGQYEIDECHLQRVLQPDGGLNVQWIFGTTHRESGLLFLTRVPDRRIESLIPLITEKVPLRSFIYSDELATYHRLTRLGYQHHTTNHSRNEYKRDVRIRGGRILNVHSNTMEGYFCLLRGRFRYRSRRNDERIDMVLAEEMWRRSGQDLLDPFKVPQN